MNSLTLKEITVSEIEYGKGKWYLALTGNGQIVCGVAHRIDVSRAGLTGDVLQVHDGIYSSPMSVSHIDRVWEIPQL
jgi:hypothetical protein